MILWVLLHALIAMVFAFVCHGVGALVLRRVPFEDAALRWAASAAIGYGLLGQCMFVLGLSGHLSRGVTAALWGAAALMAVVGVFLRKQEMALPIGRPLRVLIGIGTLPAFLIAVYPPLGFDATMYHFVYARLFAESGRIVFADALRFPVFPQMAEMHFTAAKLLFGEYAMQLTGLLALPVTALAIASLVRQSGGGDRASLFAVALWLGTPYTVYLSSSGYIDVTLTMFVTLAIACSAPALSGAFAGLAAATKYHGLFAIATFAFGSPRVVGAGRSRRSIAAFVIMAALFAAPWYAHIVRATGNPMFPYMRGIFGDHEYRTRIDQTMLSSIRDPRHAASLIPNEPPFVSVVRRAVLGPIGMGVPPHSPVLVLLLPLVIAAAGIAPRLRWPLLVAAVYAVLVSPLDWRFMIVIVPLLAVAIGIVVERLVPRRLGGGKGATPRIDVDDRELGALHVHGGELRKAVSIRERRSINTVLARIRQSGAVTPALVLVFLLPGFAWGTLLMVVKFGPLPHTPAQRDAFVAERIPVYRAVRALGPATVYVLRAQNMAYYCPGRCLGDITGPYDFRKVEPLLHDPERLATQLRAFGATHLVVDRKTPFRPTAPFQRVYHDRNATAYQIDRP